METQKNCRLLLDHPSDYMYMFGMYLVPLKCENAAAGLESLEIKDLVFPEEELSEVDDFQYLSSCIPPGSCT